MALSAVLSLPCDRDALAIRSVVPYASIVATRNIVCSRVKEYESPCGGGGMRLMSPALALSPLYRDDSRGESGTEDR